MTEVDTAKKDRINKNAVSEHVKEKTKIQHSMKGVETPEARLTAGFHQHAANMDQLSAEVFAALQGGASLDDVKEQVDQQIQLYRATIPEYVHDVFHGVGAHQQ